MIESIDFTQGAIRGWVELRNGHVPHLQLREGDIFRTCRFSLGETRADVASRRDVAAANFAMVAGRPLSPYDVQNGVTAVHAMWGASEHPLPMARRFREVVDGLVDSMPRDLSQARGNFTHVASPIGTRLASSRPEMSSFEMPVGTTSGDGVTMVGKSGHLFLRGGGNSLETQYKWGTPDGPDGSSQLIEERAEKWARLFYQRVRAARSLGIPFRQLIVPEKNSVLPHLMPMKVETPTPLCRRLLQKVSAEPWFVDCFAMFDEWEESAAPSWLKVDSHFTAHAALAVSRAVLTDLGLCQDDLFDGIRVGPAFEYLRGDMGWRIVGFDLYDRLELPDESSLTMLGPVKEPLSVVHPEHGGHLGTRIEWTNESAPIDAHVLVFGNSYFGRGQKPNQLSWWFSRFVKRLTFVWHPDVDVGLVERLAPDAVVGQTVERFLMVVPTA